MDIFNFIKKFLCKQRWHCREGQKYSHGIIGYINGINGIIAFKCKSNYGLNKKIMCKGCGRVWYVTLI